VEPHAAGADVSRALYVGPIDGRTSNGMTQHQETLLKTMAREFSRLDVLSLFASPHDAQAWLEERGIRACVMRGPFARIARANALAWQASGTLLACKLQVSDSFPFYVKTPLIRMGSYDRIFCYYAWGVVLLGLDRFGDKVTVNLGDVMAGRHRRIGLRKWISLREADERRVVRAPIRNAAISQFDADEFHRLYGVRLPVIPSVPPQHADLVALAANPRPRAAGFFAGSGNDINLATLRILAEPRFLTALRDAGIDFVVGGAICRDAPDDIRTALADGGARLIGRVPTLTDFYSAVGAMVAPVGPSSGLKMKSVETLLAGRSLITTRWGSDAVFDGFAGQVFVLDWPPDPHAMAQTVIAALQDTVSDRSDAARSYVDRSLAAFVRSIRG
jgi:hypothetical protein